MFHGRDQMRTNFNYTGTREDDTQVQVCREEWRAAGVTPDHGGFVIASCGVASGGSRWPSGKIREGELVSDSYIKPTGAEKGYLHQAVIHLSAIHTRDARDKHKSLETQTHTPNMELLTNGLRGKENKHEKDKEKVRERRDRGRRYESLKSRRDLSDRSVKEIKKVTWWIRWYAGLSLT